MGTYTEMSLWLFRHRIFVPVLNVSDVPPCGIVGFSEVEILVRFNTLWPSKGYESYDEVRVQQQRATHCQKRNYDSKAVARAFPIGCWTLRYYPPARKNKLCSPWIGPYKIVRAPMAWVVGIQIDADARIVYVHMDDLKRCATPDPKPAWPDTARGTSRTLNILALWHNQESESPKYHFTTATKQRSHQDILMCAHQQMTKT